MNRLKNELENFREYGSSWKRIKDDMYSDFLIGIVKCIVIFHVFGYELVGWMLFVLCSDSI